MPVLVKVNADRFTCVRARVAIAPSTYSCRVSVPVPTFARQMFLPVSATAQPVTARAPLSTGRADGAARHTTWCPFVPESAEVNRSGAASRYTPPVSSTTMSSDMPLLSDRTAVCAADSEHGLVAVQVVPVPAGDTYRVVAAAAAIGAGATAANAITDVTSAASRAAEKDANTGSPHTER